MKASFGLLFALVFAVGFDVQAQTTVVTPIKIPLYFTPTDTGKDKLGIYVGIGDGGTPQLFEFDTGGTGFYAAYSSLPGVSPWWGSGVVSNPAQQIGVSYDSGLTYNGTVAQGAVSLFGAATDTTPKLTLGSSTQVGQMNQIVRVNPSTQVVEQNLWSNAGNLTPNPPIDGAFYGDFGMNLAYNGNANSSGISNLIAQLNFAPGITAGFRIHADFANKQAHLQVGLTEVDLNSPTAKFFTMNLDGKAPEGASTPVTDLPFYSQQLFDANITIQGGGRDPLVSNGVGMTPDTGASTTLHNTQLSPEPLPSEYAHRIDWTNDAQDLGDLKVGLQFELSGLTTDNQSVSFFEFTTSDAVNDGNVMVQNNRPNNSNYYLNTGISFFYNYNVIYDIENGVIGLDVVPEPSVVGLLGVAMVVGYIWRRRSRRMQRI